MQVFDVSRDFGESLPGIGQRDRSFLVCGLARKVVDAAFSPSPARGAALPEVGIRPGHTASSARFVTKTTAAKENGMLRSRISARSCKPSGQAKSQGRSTLLAAAHTDATARSLNALSQRATGYHAAMNGNAVEMISRTPSPV